MIIHLNGWPGSGKLTVGRELARRLHGRLVDNHTLHNVALSVCDRNTPEYWQTFYEVREIAYARIRAMPKDETIVMTNALTRESEREVEQWNAVKKLAFDRADMLLAVTLICAEEENIRRVQSPERADNRKITDPKPLVSWRSKFSLIVEGADEWMVVDNTDLTPSEAASTILACASVSLRLLQP